MAVFSDPACFGLRWGVRTKVRAPALPKGTRYNPIPVQWAYPFITGNDQIEDQNQHLSSSYQMYKQYFVHNAGSLCIEKPLYSATVLVFTGPLRATQGTLQRCNSLILKYQFSLCCVYMSACWPVVLCETNIGSHILFNQCNILHQTQSALAILRRDGFFPISKLDFQAIRILASFTRKDSLHLLFLVLNVPPPHCAPCVMRV